MGSLAVVSCSAVSDLGLHCLYIPQSHFVSGEKIRILMYSLETHLVNYKSGVLKMRKRMGMLITQTLWRFYSKAHWLFSRLL